MITLDFLLIKDLYSQLYVTLKTHFLITLTILTLISPFPLKTRLILAIIFLTLYAMQYWSHSLFWKHQPLTNNEPGIIQTHNKQLTETNISSDINNIPHETDLIKLIDFWNNHFNNDIIITKDLLHKDIKVITLKDENKIIGTMAYSPCHLKMPNKHTHTCYYIDYFCILPEMRKTKVAYQLMDYLKQVWEYNGIEMMVFHLDDPHVLPFGTPISFHYYYTTSEQIVDKLKDIPPVNFINNGDVNALAKEMYNRLVVNRYDICMPFDDLINMSDIHVNMDNNTGLIIWRETIRKDDNSKCLEILFLLGNKIGMLKSLLINNMNNNNNKTKWDVVLMLGLKEHKDIISICEMTKSLNTKFYFYNYQLEENVTADNVCIF